MVETITKIMWAVATIIIMVGGLGFLLEMLRLKYRKIAKTRIAVDIWTFAGNVEHYLASRDANEITFKNKDGKERICYIREDATYNDDYPAGLPGFMQTVIKKVSFIEGDPEPVIKRLKDPVVNDRTIALAKDRASLEADAKELNTTSGVFGNASNAMVYALLFVIIIATGANIYFSYTSKQTISQIVQGLIKVGVIK